MIIDMLSKTMLGVAVIAFINAIPYFITGFVLIGFTLMIINIIKLIMLSDKDLKDYLNLFLHSFILTFLIIISLILHHHFY